MNVNERKKMILAMEFIARQCNDECVFDYWLSQGVADGDIEYGEMDVSKYDDDYYCEDDNFCYLMGRFLELMKKASHSGGLYCDGVTS